MAPNKSVSIIIPTRNRAQKLNNCLVSLLDQEYNDGFYEIIVVDDGSSDHTQQIVSTLRDRIKDQNSQNISYEYQESMGANHARNRGIQLAEGSIIILADDDITAPSHWLSSLIEGLQNTEAEVVTGPIKLPNSDKLDLPWPRSLFSEVLEPARHLDGRVVPVAANMAVERRVFDRAQFDETIRPPMEEVDWLIRANAETDFVDDAWVYHHKEIEGTTFFDALELSWKRGSEGGWWIRERMDVLFWQKCTYFFQTFQTALRSVGHSLIRRNLKGLVVAAGELARALSIIGLINTGTRQANSWRS